MARFEQGIYLEEVAGDMAVDTLYSRGLIKLVSDGDIVDAFADGFLNINGDGISLAGWIIRSGNPAAGKGNRLPD